MTNKTFGCAISLIVTFAKKHIGILLAFFLLPVSIVSATPFFPSDTIVPQINCPSNISVGANAGLCGAIVNYVPPVGTDNLPGATTSLLAGFAPGDTFPVGNTTVTYQATDLAGNTADCSFLVTVGADTLPPICAGPYPYSPSARRKRVPSDRTSMDNFGDDIAIWGNYAFVGAPGDDRDTVGNYSGSPGSGTVYVYEQDPGGNWIEKQKLAASQPSHLVGFGTALAVHGNYAIVGAPEESRDANGGNWLGVAGAAYLFERNASGHWTEVQKLVASDREVGDKFGFEVALYGDYALVGAPYEDNGLNGNNTVSNSGAVYFFKRDTIGQWQEIQKFSSTVLRTQKLFGSELALEGNSLWVGVSNDDLDENESSPRALAGSAYLFELNSGGQWQQMQKIAPPIRYNGGTFGISVALKGDWLFIGAPGEFLVSGGNVILDAGSAYAYSRNQSGSWQFYQRIGLPQIGYADNFGVGIDYADPFLVVGRPGPTSAQAQTGGTRGSTVGFFAQDSTGSWVFTDQRQLAEQQIAFSLAAHTDGVWIGLPNEDLDEQESNYLTNAGAVLGYGFDLRCPNDTLLYLDGNGQASLSATDLGACFSDPCGLGTLTLTDSLFTCTEVGVHLATLTVADPHGNSHNCDISIQVADTLPPVALCMDQTVYLDSAGQYTLTPQEVDNGSLFNCTGTLTVFPNQFDCADLGPQTVTLTATTSASSSTCQATITVEDSVPFILSCPDILRNTYSSSCDQQVNWSPPALDGCGATFTTVPSFPATFPVGSTPVTLTATQPDGQTHTCTFNVIVEDITPPVLNCPQNMSVSMSPNGCNGMTVSYSPPVGTDNCSGAVTFLSSGKGGGGFFDIGVNFETYTAVASNGQTTSCTFEVNIIDATPPILICPADTVVQAPPGNCNVIVSYTPPVGIDNCPGVTTTLASGIGSGGTFAAGVTQETYTTVDASGNQSFCDFTITVSSAPLVSCPADTVILAGGGVTLPDFASNAAVTPGCVGTSGGQVEDWKIYTAANAEKIYAIDTSGALWGWGLNLGHGASSSGVPVQLGTSNNWEMVYPGATHHFIKSKDGDIAGWGANRRHGQLGIGDASFSYQNPVYFGHDSVWKELACGYQFTVGLKTDSTLWVWGLGRRTGRGLNAPSVTSPIQMGSDSDWVYINVNENMAAALKSDGSLWTWGYGVHGWVPATEPAGTYQHGIYYITQVPDTSTWKKVIVYDEMILGLKSNGSLWAAGRAENLGLPSDQPTFMPLFTDSVVDIAMSGANWLARRMDGKTWGGGYNRVHNIVYHGSILYGDPAVNFQYLHPTYFPALDSLDKIWSNGRSKYGVKVVNGQVEFYSWGDFRYGTLGNGPTPSNTVYTPTQINLPFALGQVTGQGNSTYTTTQFPVAGDPLTATTQVTLTATDSTGSSTNCTFSVIVPENTPPVARCQNLTLTIEGSPGFELITAQQVDNGSTDNDAIANMTISRDSFSCADAGVHPVTLVVTDPTGNTDSCIAQVTVIGNCNLPPVAVCQDLTVYTPTNCQNGVLPAQFDNGSSDPNLDPLTFSVAPAGPYPVGVTPVLFIASDGTEADSCTVQLTVLDTLPPVAICQDLTLTLPSSGLVNLTPADLDNGSSDECSLLQRTVIPSQFTCAQTGQQSAVLFVRDAGTNLDSCTAQITVLAGPPPVAVCQDLTLVLNGQGLALLSPSDLYAGAANQCASIQLQVSQNQFNCEDIGQHPVILTLTDTANVITTCTSQVTIRPDFCGSDTSLFLDANCQALLPDFVTDAASRFCSNTYGFGTTGSGSHSWHSFAIGTEGNLWAWGKNDAGQLGIGTASTQYHPQQVSGDSLWTQVSSSSEFSVGLQKDGSLWSWGSGKWGRLGNGNLNGSALPMQVNSDSDWIAVSVGEYHVLALKSNGTLWAWGRNQFGQLGDSSSLDQHLPVQIGTDTDWEMVAAGDLHSVALKSDGSLWSWGRNYFGQLGLGHGNDVALPTQIGTSLDWTSVFSGAFHVMAVKTNGTAWGWGRNSYGELGDGTTQNRNVPVQEQSGLINWKQLRCGYQFTTGLRSDSTVWSWGRNNQGQLGDGTRSTRLIAVQEASAQANWISLSAGHSHVLAGDDQGHLYAWGYNNYGQGGNGGSPIRLVTATLVVDSADMGPTIIDSFVVTQSPVANSVLAVGTTQVQLNASNLAGQTFQCGFNVSVSDTTQPLLSGCPSDTTLSGTVADPDPELQWIAPSLTDACGNVSLTGSHQSGHEFSVGTTLVTYTGSDNYGNTDSCSFAVTVLAPGQLAADIRPYLHTCGYALPCQGASNGVLFLDITGGVPPYTITWDNGSSASLRYGLAAGTYHVTVTDANFVTDRDTIVVQASPPLAVNSQLSQILTGNISCPGGADGQIDLTVTGGASCQAYSFEWVGPNGFSSGQEDLSQLAKGNYSVIVSDANGCTTFGSYTLVENEGVWIDSVASENGNCTQGGTVTAAGGGGSGNYTYRLDGPGTFLEPQGYFHSLIAGTYAVTVIDTVTGCVSDPEWITLESELPEFAYTISPVSVVGGNDGFISFDLVTGGQAPYLYSIDSGYNLQSSPQFGGLVAGPYNLRVYDTLGCKSALVADTLWHRLSVAVNTFPNICFDDDTAYATVSVTGSPGPFQVSWSGSASGIQTGDTAFGLVGGNGFVTVRDTAYGRGTGLYFISDPTEVTYTLTTTPETSLGANDGTLTIQNVFGGQPPYQFGYVDSAQNQAPIISTSPIFSGIAPGAYYAGVFDNVGCLEGQLFTIAPASNKTGTPSDNQSLTREPSLLTAVPNPFYPFTSIHYQFPSKGALKLELYTSTGVRIKSVFEDDISSPNGVVEFDGTGLTAGLYFLKYEFAGREGEVLGGVVKLVMVR